MINLEDSQVWECETGVVQVQAMGKAFGDFRGIIFSKNKKGSLQFRYVTFNEKNRLVNLIESLNMKCIGKRIITKEKD